MISEISKFLVLLVIGAAAAIVLLLGCLWRLLTGVAAVGVCALLGAGDPAAAVTTVFSVFGG